MIAYIIFIMYIAVVSTVLGVITIEYLMTKMFLKEDTPYSLNSVTIINNWIGYHRVKGHSTVVNKNGIQRSSFDGVALFLAIATCIPFVCLLILYILCCA